MPLEVSQLFDVLAHIALIISLIYILQIVIPESKLLNKIYPESAVSVFRGMIGVALIVCFFDMLDKRESGVSEVILNAMIASISLFVCYYAPVLEHVLEENFKEKKPKQAQVTNFMEKMKSAFQKKEPVKNH